MRKIKKRAFSIGKLSLITCSWCVYIDHLVIRLGLEPKTPTLKVLCSTS